MSRTNVEKINMHVFIPKMSQTSDVIFEKLRLSYQPQMQFVKVFIDESKPNLTKGEKNRTLSLGRGFKL